jgi:hypothetical protein
VESIDFSVAYVFAEYRTFVLEHIRQIEGRPTSWIGRQLIVVTAGLAFFVKTRRMPLCTFHIDGAGIRRTTGKGALVVPWSKVIAIHRYSPGYFLGMAGGALPIPYRCLDEQQRARMDAFVSVREAELGGRENNDV